MTYSGPKYDKDNWRGTVSNGRINASMLREIEAWPVPYDRDLGGSARAHPEAASAMGILLRTAWAAGHTSLTIAYSYRTYDMQENKWAAYRAGTGNLAATPGTSNHGWAVAFDMRWGTASALTWLHANARRFGFGFDVPGENWHATFDGSWNGDDMNLEEKEQLAASRLWAQGEGEYREAHKKKGKDPGPPPDNWKTPRKQGWGSARFTVLRVEEHAKATAR